MSVQGNSPWLKASSDDEGMQSQDISLMCALACVIPWSHFFVFSDKECAESVYSKQDQIDRTISMDESADDDITMESSSISGISKNSFYAPPVK